MKYKNLFYSSVAKVTNICDDAIGIIWKFVGFKKTINVEISYYDENWKKITLDETLGIAMNYKLIWEEETDGWGHEYVCPCVLVEIYNYQFEWFDIKDLIILENKKADVSQSLAYFLYLKYFEVHYAPLGIKTQIITTDGKTRSCSINIYRPIQFMIEINC